MKSKEIFKIAAILFSVMVLAVSCTGNGAGSSSADDEQGAKVNSNYGGVQIGAITYSFRSITEVDDVIQACIDAGLSSIELMGTGIEEYLGAPENPVPRRRFFGPPPGAAPAGNAGPGNAPAENAPQMERPQRQAQPELTEEQQAAIAQYQEDLKAWREDPATMAGYEALRKKFNDAGIDIHIYKWTSGNSPEELDYSFKVAKALGAVGITAESGGEMCRILGEAAERAGMLAIYHNHMQFADENYNVDSLLALSPANRLNFDAGHYFGSTGKNPADFIEKYHDKIVSIHLKDKTGPDVEEAPNENQVWGQGQTPIEEILTLIKDNGWPIYVDIELEYPVKSWSNPVREVKICQQFCRQILL